MKPTKPIVFFDLETTGLDVNKDRIVEISITKVATDGTREVKTRRINPEMPISAKATEIHGITNEDVANEPKFAKLAKGLAGFIADSVIVGYNCLAFDIKLLFNEFKRAGVAWDYNNNEIIDSCNIFKVKEGRDLASAYKFYCGKESKSFHGAEFDVSAMMEIFKAQVKMYNLKNVPMEEIAVMSNYGYSLVDIDGKLGMNESGDIVFTFGENKGQKCTDNKKLLEWMMTGKFSDNTKQFVDYLITQC